MNNQTGKITRYNAYVITGERSAVGNYWIQADSPEQLNRMISERMANVMRSVMFHVIVFKGDFAVSASRLTQATAIAFKQRSKNIITFVQSDVYGRYLTPISFANTSSKGLIFIK